MPPEVNAFFAGSNFVCCVLLAVGGEWGLAAFNGMVVAANVAMILAKHAA